MASIKASSSGICVVSRSLDSNDLLNEPSLSMTALAQRLAVAGHSVTLLWIPRRLPASDKVREFLEYYQTNYSITVECFEHSDQLIWRMSDAQHHSFGINDYIRRQSFSDVFIPLEEGLAYYPLLSKETGVLEPETNIHVVATVPLDWCAEVDRFFFRNLDQVRISFMEKYCAQQADRLICASEDLRKWMLSRDWELSPSTHVFPSLSPFEWDSEGDAPDLVNGKAPVELVALVGSRYRDGITLFCDVLDKLSEISDLEIRVTFAGPFFQVLGEHSGGMYLRRGRRWPHRVKFVHKLNLREGVRYAKQVGAIAVVPNFDNACGYLVRECMRLGVPLVATSVGGNREEVHDKSAGHSLCEPDARALAGLIAQQVHDRSVPLPALSEEAKLRKWTGILGKKVNAGRARGGEKKKQQQHPLVSVVVVHHDRPQYLLQAISSILEQDYKNFEVILVDDGSKLPESVAALDGLQSEFDRRKWKIIRSENRYVGAARNTGVRASTGEFIIFVDDDNALLPGAISKYVSAILKSDADVCTALCKNFYGANVPGSPRLHFVGYLPLGGSLDVSLIESCFGDTMSIYRRSVFDKVGFQLEEFGYMVEDYEYFVRICLAGLKIRVIPEALFLYRISTRGRYRSSHYYDNHQPILRAFEKANFAGFKSIYSLIIGQNKSEYERQSYKTNLGYSPSDEGLLRLCEMEPNEEKAVRLLAKIAAVDSRPETAIDLLASLKPNELDKEIEALVHISSASRNALKAVNSFGVVKKALDLNDLRAMEACSTASDDAIPLSYVEEPARYLIEASGGFTSAAVLAAGCPASTTAATCNVSSYDADVEFLLLLCPMHEDPLVAVTAARLESSEGCSGWTRVSTPSQGVAVRAQLSTPSAVPMNLIVAVRTSGEDQGTVLGCFENMHVHVSLEDRSNRRPRLGAPQYRLRSRSWTNEERRSAKVVLSYPSRLPVLLLPKQQEGGIFLRPAKEGPVVATIEQGFPAFARRLFAQVEVAHDEAPAIEFAVALTLPTNQVEWRIDGPKAPMAFSGWVGVREKFKLQDIGLKVTEQFPMALTISLAVRFPRGSYAGPTNAFFRNVQFLWDE